MPNSFVIQRYSFLPLLMAHLLWGLNMKALPDRKHVNFTWLQQTKLFFNVILHSKSPVFVPHHPHWPRDWFGQQVTRHSQLRCTTWTPTSWTPTPWHWRLLGRSFRTTTVTRCSPLWALEPNCLLMDGCHMSFHWWSQPPLFPLCDHFFMLLASNLNNSEFYF